MPSYISCDGDPVDIPNAYALCYASDGATVLSEQEVMDLYSPPLTAEDGWLVATTIFTVAFFSWGFKLALKQLNVGV